MYQPTIATKSSAVMPSLRPKKFNTSGAFLLESRSKSAGGLPEFASDRVNLSSLSCALTGVRKQSVVIRIMMFFIFQSYQFVNDKSTRVSKIWSRLA